MYDIYFISENNTKILSSIDLIQMYSNIDFLKKKIINISTDRSLQKKVINISKHDTNWK